MGRGGWAVEPQESWVRCMVDVASVLMFKDDVGSSGRCCC